MRLKEKRMKTRGIIKTALGKKSPQYTQYGTLGVIKSPL
jgi:hypothetical protein